MEINPEATCKVNELASPGQVVLGQGGNGFKALCVDTATGNMASIADGADGGLELTVSGVALGDVVLGVSAAIDIGDQVILHGQVTATDTVYVTMFNRSGGTIDLASTTYTIVWLDKS